MTVLLVLAVLAANAVASVRHPEGPRRCMDRPVVLEIEEEPVVAGGRARKAESDLGPWLRVPVTRLAQRVHVQVGQVTGPDGHEVPEGAEVGLEIGDGCALAGHHDAHDRLATAGGLQEQLQVVAVDARGRRDCRGRLRG